MCIRYCYPGTSRGAKAEDMGKAHPRVLLGHSLTQMLTDCWGHNDFHFLQTFNYYRLLGSRCDNSSKRLQLFNIINFYEKWKFLNIVLHLGREKTSSYFPLPLKHMHTCMSAHTHRHTLIQTHTHIYIFLFWGLNFLYYTPWCSVPMN